MLDYSARVLIAVSLVCGVAASAGQPLGDAAPEGRSPFGYPQETPAQATLIREAEREGYEVRRTEFLGNARTSDALLRRRLTLTEGDTFTSEELGRSIRRLGGLKMIKPVRLKDVEVRLDRRYKVIDLAFRVREKR